MTENQSNIEYFFFKETFNCFSIAFITNHYNILPLSMHWMNHGCTEWQHEGYGLRDKIVLTFPQKTKTE